MMVTDERIRDVADDIRALFEVVDGIQNPDSHDKAEDFAYDSAVVMIRELITESHRFPGDNMKLLNPEALEPGSDAHPAEGSTPSPSS